MENIDKSINDQNLQNLRTARKDKRHIPHTYVLYTMSGKEHETIQMMNTSISKHIEIPRSDSVVLYSNDEYFFCPTASFERKLHGERVVVEQRLYPGYIFLVTPDPLEFFLRMRDFQRFFHKFLRLMTNPKIAPISDKRDSESLKIAKAREEKWEKRRKGESVEEWVWRIFKYFVVPLSDEEESVVLGVCGLERDPFGNIVKRQDRISKDDIGKLIEKGFTMSDMFGPKATVVDYGDADKTDKSGKTDKTNKPLVTERDIQNPTGYNIFNADMSYGVKIGKRVFVTYGALVGREGDIRSFDRHKRECVINMNLLGRDVPIRMPLTVIKSMPG